MRCLILALAAIALCSCASAPRTAPRFSAPTTKHIQQSAQSAKGHVQDAKKQAEGLAKEAPQLKLQITALQISLDGALSDLNTLEGARKQLQAELALQTKQANNLADNYDKASAQITSLKTSRHRYVKYCWYLGGLLALSVVWILRRPLLLLIGGLGA
jgi:Skp family chaperone for outer membrane proteins